mgnify:CR=1 FL=1
MMNVTMDVTNDYPQENPLLTQGDLAIAAYALSEVFNSYLEQYQQEQYGELTKDQIIEILFSDKENHE